MTKTQVEKYSELINSLKLTDDQKLKLHNIWLDYYDMLDNRARTGWRIKTLLQVLAIMAGIFIPVLANLDLGSDTWYTTGQNKYVITILGLLSAIAVGMLQRFNLESRWKHYRKYAEIARVEGEKFLGLSDTSRQIDFECFIASVLDLKSLESTLYFKGRKEKNREEGE